MFRGGKTETKHEHYTNFELDEKIFRCYGDLIFKDGDSVKFYADKTDKGYYKVKYIENITRNFTKADSYFDNPPKGMFGAVIKGIFGGAIFGVILATIIAVILSNFAKFSDMICGIIWIIIVVLCILFAIWSSVDYMKRYIADFEINNKTD